ncbi:MAG TPA: 4Fe-4S binding protein [Prolixibacteraceae bacterium]|nr:4Fe-4S binding protein [Prolixibacteraceae bacterium]HPS12714.1 4Fe-4S binding protein [Prolixibacteraceae bacterium]
MKSIIEYIVSIFKGLSSLLAGMRVTGKYAFTPWKNVTIQYPDVRPVMTDRFRGEVIMPHNENNEHKCTACGICEMNCPNGSIEVISKTITTPEGKKKRVLDQYIYHLGMCTFCNLCVKACPSDAIDMGKNFELAVWDRTKLNKVLNQPGSKIAEGVKE